MGKLEILLSESQALHLWSILVGYQFDTSNELKRRGTFKSDGTVKKSRKYFSDVEQELMDNIAISKLISDRIEVEYPDFFDVKEQA